MVPGILALHHDPNQWHHPRTFEPLRFDTEHRWFHTPESNNTLRRDPCTYLPFGQGIRACPGQSLALLELKIMTVFFMKQSQWQVNRLALCKHSWPCQK